THKAGGTAGNLGADGNVASGVLRGMWGVEPNYGAQTTWPQAPTSYTVKSGVPSVSTVRSSTYLTREYQLCFKCHSDYSNSLVAASFPLLRGAVYGGTPSGISGNGLTVYTNVAAEFAASTTATDPPSTGTDQGENGNDPAYTPSNPNGAPIGAPTNHRSWHPVVMPTGRTSYERTGNNVTVFSNIRAPFNTAANIGKQTMQCSDCHGEPTSWTVGTGPDLTKTQGPHGSSENFLLKGKWDITQTITSATGASPTAVCGRCHDPSGNGGFNSGDAGHTTNSDHQAMARCQFCHIALPHGWKNKAFLVNLNCLGPEAGKPTGCTSAFGGTTGDTRQLWAAPYYNGALLRVSTWQSSTAWTETSCGGGRSWMDAACAGAATTQQAQTPPLPAAGGY
ncbi:MAG TPA: hypothetical protein VGK14_04945, partial [Novimethylophilus sp.]|uniref:hypothetical protein n=1 Tax=Novimethylophilus sp. TaxID=2137426 RepID=UPI002F40B562